MNRGVLITIVVVLVIVVGGVLWIIFGPALGLKTGGGLFGEQTKFSIEGMQVEILKQGKGEGAKNGDAVTVHYVTFLSDGKQVDSSYERNRPFGFRLGKGQVIKGWELGVVGMKVGEKRKLTVPPEMAYGEFGFSSAGIPPKSTLVFEVDLLVIKPR